jgi:DNA-binding NarL/FixJ family response regulator
MIGGFDPCRDRGRVLVADDDPSVLRGTSIVLRTGGFEVDAVGSGHEAAAALSRDRYDALVADINMPGNRELELLRDRGVAGAVPVVLITGEPTLETAVSALRIGVVDYVSKPVHPDTLLSCVSAAVEKGRALRAFHDARAHASAVLAAADALESAIASAQVPGRLRTSEVAGPPSGGPLDRLTPEERARLSPRESDVVRLLAVGHPIQEVASILELSANTVRNHMKSVFTKLGVRSQVALLGKLAGYPPAAAHARKRRA